MVKDMNSRWREINNALAGLSENALTTALAKLEKDNGKPFPKRKREPKGGRPLK